MHVFIHTNEEFSSQIVILSTLLIFYKLSNMSDKCKITLLRFIFVMEDCKWNETNIIDV